MGSARIGILVVAYNAASTLHRVLDRIPADFHDRIAEVLVADDASLDATHLVALGYQQGSGLPISVVRHNENLGYGGNQKTGYQWAIEHDWDIVVLLHGDGQYAPELLPQMVAPIERGECDAVFGSRMLEPGSARSGGMPLYKFIGNKILTRAQNALAGATLSEWHSGYRAYSVAALAEIPFSENDDGFNFDTQIILQLLGAGRKIKEIPIPTYYGDEICYVDGVKYAKDVVGDVARFRLTKMGLGHSRQPDGLAAPYQFKAHPDSSHCKLLAWIEPRRPEKVLDLGCSDGEFADRLRASGADVVGVDIVEHPAVARRVSRFVHADLDDGLPQELGDDFDAVVAADVVEHVRKPEELLAQLHDVLDRRGRLYVSVPNFGHWYPRLRVMVGKFDYDQRGILDEGHVRFFTRDSIEDLFARSGWLVERRTHAETPFWLAISDQRSSLVRSLSRIDRLLTAVWPRLFAYQFLYELSVDGRSR